MNLIPADHNIIHRYSSMKAYIPGVEQPCFIADSERVVLKLLQQTNVKIESLLATDEFYQRHQGLTQHLTASLYLADKHILEQIVGHDLHQGVMACAIKPQDHAIEEMLDGPLLMVDGVNKADNIGAIIRSCAAFGVTSIVLDPRSCHPYNRRAVRVSMGNIFRMKVHQTNNLATAITEIKSHGYTIYAFENRTFAKDLTQTKFDTKCALLIGSEATGISLNILKLADQVVRIPIDEEVYALNAAMATTVALYELSRHRI